MTISSKLEVLSFLALHPHLVTCRTRYLFVFSHMRSRSSVLSHVLGSNPSVTGYTELQIPYTKRSDLLKMRALLFQDSRMNLNNQYLLDKILHNKFPISDQIFQVANPKAIFLLRSPKATFKSILNMNAITGVEYYSTPEEVLEYYCSRLANLELLARKMAGQYFFIESDELINNTDEVLYRLTDWLQLRDLLRGEYSIFDKTGVPGFGDPLDHIKSGVLMETPKINTIKIPEEILKTAERAYGRAMQTLVTMTSEDLACCSSDYLQRVSSF